MPNRRNTDDDISESPHLARHSERIKFSETTMHDLELRVRKLEIDAANHSWIPAVMASLLSATITAIVSHFFNNPRM